MIGLEIIDKEINWHRLTVTPNRVTMKIKSSASKDEREKVINLFSLIAEEVQLKTKVSLRTNWDERLTYLRLRTDKQVIIVDVVIDNYQIKKLIWKEN